MKFDQNSLQDQLNIIPMSHVINPDPMTAAIAIHKFNDIHPLFDALLIFSPFCRSSSVGLGYHGRIKYLMEAKLPEFFRHLKVSNNGDIFSSSRPFQDNLAKALPASTAIVFAMQKLSIIIYL